MTSDAGPARRLSCALCGQEPLRPETATYVACDRCGTISQAATPVTLGIEESAGRYSHGVLAEERRWLDLIETLDPPGRRLLDLGCGDGAFVGLAAERGWFASGVEASPAMVAGAVARGCDVRAGDLDVWTASATYDVVRLWYVLEHVREPGRLLAGACAAVVPGGLLIVAIPNDAGWLSRRVMASPDDRFWEHPLHLNHFPPFGLERWIESRGLTLEIGEATRPTELMRGGTLPLHETWESVRAADPALSRLFYKLGVGRGRELAFRRLPSGE